MPAKKYVGLVGGRLQEVAATVASAGAADDGKIPALGTDGRLDPTVMAAGVGADTRTVIASEALSAGNPVNLWNDAGVLKARKADATTAGKEADGFVIAAVAAAANATVYFEGTITGLAALTLGSRVFLAIVAGGVTHTAPSAAGNVVQYLGKALSATEVTFEPDDGVVLA